MVLRIPITPLRLVLCTGLLALAAGCAVQAPEQPSQLPRQIRCEAPKQGEPLVGNWMGIRKQKGVAGELRVRIDLRADGTMAYEEQLKRGSRTGPMLNETGCWSQHNGVLTLHTLKSNGEPVDVDDPIYRNQYSVQPRSSDRLVLENENGALAARRMPSDYRLPAL